MENEPLIHNSKFKINEFKNHIYVVCNRSTEQLPHL